MCFVPFQVDDVYPRVSSSPTPMESITCGNFSPTAIPEAISEEEEEENTEESVPIIDRFLNDRIAIGEDKRPKTPVIDVTQEHCRTSYMVEAYRNPIAELDSDTDSENNVRAIHQQALTTSRGRDLTSQDENSFTRVFSSMQYLDRAEKATNHGDGHKIGCVDETDSLSGLSTPDEFKIDEGPPPCT